MKRKCMLFAAVLIVLLLPGGVLAQDMAPEVWGVNQLVTLPSGQSVAAINFDNAATTPPFSSVMEAIAREAKMYGSIGRGTGQKSVYSTEVYERVRGQVLNFFSAPADQYMVVYVSNATDGLNRLALSLLADEEDIVLTTRMEHHANDLPWRRRARVLYAEVDSQGRLDFTSLEGLLKENQVKILSLTAASNVTGYINDVHRAARLAHEHGALVVVDGAQIAAHRPFSMLGATPVENIDFFVFSAHKMYAPFGGGAIIGRRDLMEKMPMAFTGGGVVGVVGDERQTYLQHEARLEPGSPNYFGVVAMGEAIQVLSAIGFETIINHERALSQKMVAALEQIVGVTVYGDWQSDEDRVGLVVFNVQGLSDFELAQQLAQRRGIAVRQGAFCAHPYVARLLGVNPIDQQLDNPDFHLPGMVRASFGIYNSEAEVDEFIKTVKEIARELHVD